MSGDDEMRKGRGPRPGLAWRPRPLSKRVDTPRLAGALVAAVLVAALVGGCGGGSKSAVGNAGGVGQTQSSGGETGSADASAAVARVGNVAITRGEVNHWMTALGGKLFYVDSGTQRMPEGLLSDPANYPRCVSSLEAAAVKAIVHVHESAAELLAKCRLLYREFKIYAMGYLITDQQLIQTAKQMGVTVTSAQVQAQFRATAAHEYPTSAALHSYLTLNYRTVPDLLLEAEVAMLDNGLYRKFKTTQGRNHYEKTRAEAVSATSCSPGYQVEGCGNFKGHVSVITPPSVLMEGLVHTA